MGELIPRGGATVIDLIGSASPPAVTVKLSDGVAAEMFEREAWDAVGLPGLGVGVRVRVGVGVARGVGASTSTLALVAVTVTRSSG